MKKINESTIKAILKKTPWGHSVRPFEEGLNEDEIKGLFYRALTDEKNSVISEINRIVEEANDELSKADVTERLGKIEDCPLFEKTQKWIRVNKLLVCNSVSRIDSSDVEILQDVTNASIGKRIVLKITAPEGVIPSESLALKIGEKKFSGLELLRNDKDEALKGIYYLFVAVPAEDVFEELSIKWNKDTDFEKVLFEFPCSVGGNLKTYFKYATSQIGENASEEWNENQKYMGLFIGENDTQDLNRYVWFRFLPDFVSWREESVTISDWQEDDRYDIGSISVSASDKIIAGPSAGSIDDWTKCGMYCVVDDNSNLVVKYKKKPTSSITIDFLIGVNK